MGEYGVKPIFISESHFEISRLNKYLSSFKTEIISLDNGNMWGIIANENIEGCIKEGHNYINRYNYDVIELYGNKKLPKQAISLAYVILKDPEILRKDKWMYTRSDYKFSWRIIEDLSRLLGFNVYCDVNKRQGTIEFICDAPKEEQENLKQKAMLYLNFIKSICFQGVYAIDEEGKIIVEETKKEKTQTLEQNKMMLFNQTLFYQAIASPKSNNIVPKVEDEEKSRYIQSGRSFGIEKSHLEVSKEKEMVVIKGIYKLMEKGSYNAYWDNSNQKKYSIPKTEIIKYDDISFTSTLDVEDETLVITTTFNDKRRFKRDFRSLVKASDFESVRDEVFRMPDGLTEYDDTIKEYFVKFNKGSKLLHYSDCSPLFEVYSIPEDFAFESSSLNNQNPEVYNKTNCDDLDESLNEVYKYIKPDVKELKKVN